MSSQPGSPGPSKPQVVATLSGRTPEELKLECRRASEMGADLIEFRLDRMRPEDIDRLDTVHQIPIEFEWVPAIATLRSRTEGGEGPATEAERLKLLESALESLPFTYVDLELARDLGIAHEISSSFGRPVAQIFSAHLPLDTPLSVVADNLNRAMEAGAIGKVVVPASVARTMEELIPLAEKLRGKPYVLHTTGPSGPLLRLLSRQLEMGMVYATLPDAVHGPVEPAQLPLPDLKEYLDAPLGTPWLAVVGNPIAHSLSPKIHRRFLREAKLPWLYVALQLESGKELRDVLPRLVTWGMAGMNVTAPFKTDAAEISTASEEEVSVSGAANTLWREAGAAPVIRSANTDVLALRRILEELHGSGWSGDRLLIVGGGGAARAATAAGVEFGAHVYVTGRSDARVRAMVNDFPPEFVHMVPAASLTPFPLVVHATPAGQAGAQDLEVPIRGALAPRGVLLDLVYAQSASQLKEMAVQSGARYLTGGRMLVYQAAESFQRFTGKTPSSALLEELIREVNQ